MLKISTKYQQSCEQKTHCEHHFFFSVLLQSFFFDQVFHVSKHIMYIFSLNYIHKLREIKWNPEKFQSTDSNCRFCFAYTTFRENIPYSPFALTIKSLKYWFGTHLGTLLAGKVYFSTRWRILFLRFVVLAMQYKITLDDRTFTVFFKQYCKTLQSCCYKFSGNSKEMGYSKSREKPRSEGGPTKHDTAPQGLEGPGWKRDSLPWEAHTVPVPSGSSNRRQGQRQAQRAGYEINPTSCEDKTRDETGDKLPTEQG